MAVALTHQLSNGSATDASTYTTASVSVTAGDILWVVVTNASTVGTADALSGVVGTLGTTLTWTTAGSVLMNSSSRGRTTIAWALCGSTTSGTLTFQFGGVTQASGQWTVITSTGSDTTTPVANVQTQQFSLANPSMTLSPSPAATSAVLAAMHVNGSTGGTAGTGYALIGSGTAQTTPAITQSTEQDVSSPSATVAFVNAGTLNRGMIALEIQVPTGVTGTASVSETVTIDGTGVTGTSSGASVSETASVTAGGSVGASSSGSVSETITITAGGVVGRSATAAVSESVTITASGSVGGGSPSGTAAVAPTVTITATGTTGTVGGAPVSETVAITSAGVKGAVGSAAVSPAVAITAAGVVGKAGTASLSETAAITASGRTGASTSAAVNTGVAIVATGVVGVASSAPVSLAVTITASSSAFEPAGPTPAERIVIIEAEDRVLVVEAEDRTVTVRAESRTLVVEAEDRVIRIRAENRLLEVPS